MLTILCSPLSCWLMSSSEPDVLSVWNQSRQVGKLPCINPARYIFEAFDCHRHGTYQAIHVIRVRVYHLLIMPHFSPKWMVQYPVSRRYFPSTRATVLTRNQKSKVHVPIVHSPQSPRSGWPNKYLEPASLMRSSPRDALIDATQGELQA